MCNFCSCELSKKGSYVSKTAHERGFSNFEKSMPGFFSCLHPAFVKVQIAFLLS